jgi:hypothetical protein
MKITHVYPHIGIRLGEWDRTTVPPVWKEDKQTFIGNGDTVADVFQAIRYTTLHDEGVLFVEAHQYATDDFLEELEKGQFDRSFVTFLSLDPVKKTIHVPESGPYKSELVRASDGKVIYTQEVPGTPATTKETIAERYHDFSTLRHARDIASKATGSTTTVVIWEPDVEGGDLDHLSELPNDMHVVIFHRFSDHYGVVVEGDVDPENWEGEFPPLASLQFDPPAVIAEDLFIQGNIHVLAGRFEAFKTMGLIEASDAILSERPVFDHFMVKHRFPIMFLCADMSPELFSDYAAPFNLRKHGDDFRVLNPKGHIMHAIDSPVLQRAVRGRILILDTMLDFAKIKEAFQSGEWITFMQKLRELITIHGCIAVIMTAHATKTGAKSNTIDPSEYLKDSVTFGGKIDIGFAFSKLENTSQIFVERIKSRGFKKPLSFTITVNDEEGNCNFDRGRFPVCLKPGEAGKKEDHVVRDKGGRRPNPGRNALTQQIVQLKNDGASFSKIAEQLKLTVITTKRYYKSSFDTDKE